MINFLIKFGAADSGQKSESGAPTLFATSCWQMGLGVSLGGGKWSPGLDPGLRTQDRFFRDSSILDEI